MPQNEYERAYQSGNSHLRPAYEPTQFNSVEERRGYEQGKADREYNERRVANINNRRGGGGGGNTVTIDPRAIVGLGIILVAPLFAAVWCLLYPLPVLCGVSAGLAAGRAVDQLIPAPAGHPAPLYLTAVPWVVGSIVTLYLARFDHRLAASALYRAPRYLVRVVLFGLLGLVIAWAVGRGQYVRSLPTLVDIVWSSTPPEQAAGAGTALFAVLVLRWTWLRRHWHRLLETIRLRPRGLPARRPRPAVRS